MRSQRQAPTIARGSSWAAPGLPPRTALPHTGSSLGPGGERGMCVGWTEMQPETRSGQHTDRTSSAAPPGENLGATSQLKGH